MSDLISRKALKLGFCKDKKNTYNLEDILEIIDLIPTTYDVDKVTEQLDEAYNNSTLGDYLKIVKGGGQGE